MKFCVSLTTIPSRINNIKQTIDSIINQSIKPNKIFLNLPNTFKRFKNDSFTEEEIKRINYENLEIVRCDDFGPGTKIMGSIEKIKNNYDFVVLIDDDHEYHPRFLEIFSNNFKKNPINYSFYLNKIFDIKMGQCADGFLFNCVFLDKIEKFYSNYVNDNKNLFHDDDLWIAIYLYCVKKTKIVNLIQEFQNITKEQIVYKPTTNQNIDALHKTVHKDKLFINRRKIQKLEYLKYFFLMRFIYRS
tara:strand:- start:173 stop:907 length:735 start_codon:yes stop_codon:yes gene_type:complete